MTRAEKRLAVRSGVLGVLLTLLVMAADFAGAFGAFDNWLYDQRARRCQLFVRPPTDLLVHIDLDDQTLLSIGWPVQREVIAEIVDEIARARAKVLAFDVVFSETQSATYEIERPDAEPGGDPSTRPAVVRREIDHDALLADAIHRFGRVVVPASFDLATAEESPLHDAVRSVLIEDLEIAAADVGERLRAQDGYGGGAELDRQVVGVFAPALRSAAYERIAAAMRSRPVETSTTTRPTTPADTNTFDDLRRQLLPRTGAAVTRSALINVVRTEFDRWQAQQALRRLARSEAVSAGAPILPARDVLAPIAPLARAASGTGFVDYLAEGDGVIRKMPLWINYRNGVYPQEGLALACAMLDINPADPQRVTISEDAVTLSPPDGRKPVIIPVRTIYAPNLGQDAGTCMEIPWFGGNDWTRMYASAKRDPHLSADVVWQVCLTRRSVRVNNAAADDAISFFLARLDPDRLRTFIANPVPPDDFETRAKTIDSLLAELKEAGWLEGYEGKPLEAFTDPVDRTLVSSLAALWSVRSGNVELCERLQRQEAQLRDRLEGRAALFGWVATAAAGSDFVPTPLHPRCPGVVIHGAIFNAIMTGELWRTMPQWGKQLFTLAIGLFTTAAVTFLTPWKAVGAILAMFAVYLVFNGIVLFDWLDVTAGGAGALIVAGVVYSSLTLMRLLVEGLERARITGRFRSYVDPTLVDYVIEHPDTARLEGEVRELTVVFTDLTEFTALSEKLGEATVPVLNRYFDCMVPIIRKHRGYVNKFLGDGIMFFFGAPLANDNHAVDAVATVLEMRTALAAFNEQLAAEGLEPLAMRAGVSTGRVVVGDAGSNDASDYTVLGDAVNVGSRLESAGKVTGTRNVVSGRTAELLGGQYLLRPIGKLQVAGRTRTVVTYEVLCATAEATLDDQRLAELTAEMVTAYFDSRFERCLDAITRLEATFGEETLTRLYRHLCERHQSEPPAEAFAGEIVVAEK